MNDKKTTIQELIDLVVAFADEREWRKAHTPKDLSMAISRESTELLEKFLWMDEARSHQEVEENREEIEHELADILIYAIHFAKLTNIDICSAVEKKLKYNEVRYPVEKSKGRYDKWDRLQ